MTVIWLAAGCVLSLCGAVVSLARADTRHAHGGWQGPPPTPASARAFGVLALGLWVAVLVVGVATLLL